MDRRRTLAHLVQRYGAEALAISWISPTGKPQARPGFRTIRATRPEWGLSRWEAQDLAGWVCATLDGAAVTLPDTDGGDTGERVHVERDDHGLAVSAKGQGLVKTLGDLIEHADIDVSEWRIGRYSVNTWTTPIKGDDGAPVIVRNWQVKAQLEPRLELHALASLRSPSPAVEEVRVELATSTLIVPDSQHGFRWGGPDRRTLTAMHDEEACALAIRVAREMRPDRIILLGDMADFAELSTKFPRPPELLGTTQATIEALHAWIAEFRAACPATEIVYMEGNHEARLRAMLVQQAGSLADIRAAGETEPAMSVPRLLGLPSLGVRYVGPYGEDWWADGRVRICHGTKVRTKGGATVQAVLADAQHTTWFGHIHRLELAQRTVHGPEGARVITAASPGCLCRVDGSVPGATARPDWQHGLGFMWSDARADHCEVRPIIGGAIYFNGRRLTA